MDFSAFSHGQIQSKLWLCEQLERHISSNIRLVILGSWYNTLGFLMLSRHAARYRLLTGIDVDSENIEKSNKLLDAWMIGRDAKASHICKNVNQLTSKDLEIYHVIVNTSCEHMDNHWFDLVNKDQLLCLQTSNMVTDDPGWNITNPNPDIETFQKKYPMSQILFAEEKVFDYGHLKYSRYMLIGKK